ncbi:hypothetical protein [Desertivirga xinjiangensis]|uniref:hypothetical protein n=1 Tax=Desertivirga xinjiangensis TaxID=539206 RepID=UPI00210A45C4|nr:hypothetical protein [Pedobacter xinjiangensis]
MKRILSSCFLIFGMCVANAQEGAVEDQNPNYLISQKKYIENADSIKLMIASTAETLYVPYDPDAAKHARRQQRREWRHQERMVPDNYYYGGSGWNLGFGYNWFNNGSRWNNWGGYHNRWHSPYRRWRW